ncbi:MAG TPA: TetR/AcrR family transcriptional regulator [Paraburkholderia sp.]|uniref:TetR/AcrR family transcriptional regulator n=1 Tax=Paraburkholderia sp. TaxID=1926495 RepID=UPI002D034FDB|nr:TetR/AcrR family transcriptional regulator [Paraburkholderia sp.]HTR09469.1 TetR/AcrR family transcriptional regulator [Paraburkholderia sp.]
MGRPREFDESQVLDAACAAFWTHGYEATSTRDLVKATGLTQPSLYNAFGDKRALFLRVLDHYLRNTLRERMERLEATASPGTAITAFFGEIVQRSLDDTYPRGCLMVNSALEATPEDEELRAALTAEFTQIRDFFLRCLEAGQRSGEIPRVVSASAAAQHLLAVLLGVRVIARVHPERDWLVDSVSPALTLLGLLPAASREHSAAKHGAPRA